MKFIKISLLFIFLVSLRNPVLSIAIVIAVPVAILSRLAPLIARFTISRAVLAGLGLASLGATGIALGILVVHVIQAKNIDNEILGKDLKTMLTK